MKTIKEWFRTEQIRAAFWVLLGLLAGWLFFHAPDTASHTGAQVSSATEPTEEADGHSHAPATSPGAAPVWTCSMHPQIRQDKPGKCPLCGMDLIPLKTGSQGEGNSGDLDPDAIQLSEEAIALADVQTSPARRENPVKRVRLYGKITPDERSLQSQTAHVSGRIESLAVDFTGVAVRRGQTLAVLYSPDLFTAQQELLEAVQMHQPALVAAAREKLSLWKMTPAQIEAVELTGKTSPLVEIKSNTDGIVLTKRVSPGDYVSQGAVLFDVADLAQVWAVFDAFEVDLPFLSKGDAVSFTLQALPGKKFSGKIAFVDPLLNPTTRTARVRVDVPNTGFQLKPEMYATAIIEAPLRNYRREIVIPQTAVLWTGKRAIVYVKEAGASVPTFRMREIELGPSLGGAYVVLSGLEEGEDIVTDGVFAVDASAQLEGKPSMMNRTEEKGAQSHEKQAMKSEHAMLGVRGACGMCQTRIEKTALSVRGVVSAHWDKAKQMLHLQYDPSLTSVGDVSRAIAAAGHDTDMDKADQTVYDQLPGCCHYRP